MTQFVALGDGIAETKSALQDEAASAPTAVDGDIFSAVRIHRVNRILVALGDRRGKLPVQSLLTLKSRGVLIQDSTDLYEAITGKVPIESLRLGWLLFSPGFCVSRFLVVYKRLISGLMSILGLTISLPLLPFIALAIKLTSQGPIFYRQKRVGRNGTVFECYKLRTMRADAEADTGPTWAGDDDPRITTVGRFLRTSRLDEIPHLWNVLRGDMSLVGAPSGRAALEFVGNGSAAKFPTITCDMRCGPASLGWAPRFDTSTEARSERHQTKSSDMTSSISRICRLVSIYSSFSARSKSYFWDGAQNEAVVLVVLVLSLFCLCGLPDLFVYTGEIMASVSSTGKHLSQRYHCPGSSQRREKPAG